MSVITADLVLWMLRLSVTDRADVQWVPLLGYNDEVVAYAPSVEAFNTLYESHSV